MAKIGVIGGTGVMGFSIFRDAESGIVKTTYGNVNVLYSGNTVFVQRHDRDGKIVPPHRINYLANMKVFEQEGIKYVIGTSSTGSLQKNISPGDIVVPSDYVCFDDVTYFDNELVFITPGISQDVREALIRAAEKAGVRLHKEGVYVNAKGPRLDTKAEVSMFSRMGFSVIGMTMAKEATLAKELGISYASICSVDNYGNGLSEKPLENKMIEKTQKANFRNVQKILTESIKLLDKSRNR